ncbi:hypothetical protein KIPB_012798 [Kipferlia bialata]|uniref:Uncharacterized protein n=1 Tax=Kipferlia bialata TaxID=797122 RepID=A0A9K3DA81_9EUKA|nr:hypothetical protein KIPB_012798 [Kipferlia bialata]|eukprot:g12798.t1
MTMGTTHVAAGFNDLGLLLTANVVPHRSGHATNTPLRFIGYDLAPYNVAKNMVVWHMIQTVPDRDCATAVLQVWYSAIWERSTDRYFQRAALEVVMPMLPTYLLGGTSSPKDIPESVRILMHWAGAAESKVPLEGAMIAFADFTGNTGVISTIGSTFTHKADRGAFLRLDLTGAFAVPEVTGRQRQRDLVGSAAMFDVRHPVID